MPTKIYTMGYGGRTVETFAQVVEELDATIVDVRFWPGSKSQPDWNKGAMMTRFGPLTFTQQQNRYVHMPHWGNANRFKGGPMKLANFEGGLKFFETLPDRPAILMCACRNKVECHRGVLLAPMLEARGYEVEELKWPQRVAAPKPELKNLKLVMPGG